MRVTKRKVITPMPPFSLLKARERNATKQIPYLGEIIDTLLPSVSLRWKHHV